MDEELRDSLMEWYLRFGEREVVWFEIAEDALRYAFYSHYTKSVNLCTKITPEGIKALKNG